MKSLEQIKELFVSARELVKVASPDSVDVVIEKITEISNHCKELYEIETSYIERAKCINMYTSYTHGRSSEENELLPDVP